MTKPRNSPRYTAKPRFEQNSHFTLLGILMLPGIHCIKTLSSFRSTDLVTGLISKHNMDESIFFYRNINSQVRCGVCWNYSKEYACTTEYST